ncbi:MAG: Na+/H+ antiporter NhaC family protein, partial [Oscillospiraceae bacterium]
SAVIYSILSAQNPLLSGDSQILLTEIAGRYNLTPLVCLPAFVILILPFFKLEIKKSMGISIITACAIAIFVQGTPPMTMASQLIFGYTPPFESWFGDLIKGGGLLSMVNSAFVIIIAATYAGIIKEAHIFNGLDEFILKLSRSVGIFPATILVAISTALFSCNQTLCIMLTHQLMEGANKINDRYPLEIASDIANTAVVISPLIPWNIAVSIPLGMMNVGWGAIPFAFYLVLIPLTMCVKSIFHRAENQK